MYWLLYVPTSQYVCEYIFYPYMCIVINNFWFTLAPVEYSTTAWCCTLCCLNMSLIIGIFLQKFSTHIYMTVWWCTDQCTILYIDNDYLIMRWFAYFSKFQTVISYYTLLELFRTLCGNCMRYHIWHTTFLIT